MSNLVPVLGGDEEPRYRPVAVDDALLVEHDVGVGAHPLFEVRVEHRRGRDRPCPRSSVPAPFSSRRPRRSRRGWPRGSRRCTNTRRAASRSSARVRSRCSTRVIRCVIQIPLVSIYREYLKVKPPGRSGCSVRWCVWLVGGDRASGRVRERRRVAGAGADVLVVQELVVSVAEQDQVDELGPAVVLVGDEVVRFELARCGAAGVLTMA